jgi:hypothetical protein
MTTPNHHHADFELQKSLYVDEQDHELGLEMYCSGAAYQHYQVTLHGELWYRVYRS